MDKRYASAEKITLVKRDPSGKISTGIHYQRARTKRRGTLGLRSIDDFVRRITRSEMVMDQSYLSRHDRSNKERPDGWLLDLEPNIVNAVRKGLREFDKDLEDDEDQDREEDLDDDDDDDEIKD